MRDGSHRQHPFRRVPLVALAAVTAPLWFLSGCASSTLSDEAQFAADYVEDYESDQADDVTDQAVFTALDQYDDLDDIDGLLDVGVSDMGNLQLGPQVQALRQGLTAAHGPVPILEDLGANIFFPSAPQGDAACSTATSPASCWLTEARDLGVKVIRLHLTWASVLPTSAACPCAAWKAGQTPDQDPAHLTAIPDWLHDLDPAAYCWSAYDSVISAAQALHLGVLITLSAPMPFWASDDPAHCAGELKADPSLWSCSWKPQPYRHARFITAAARHFRQQGFHIWGWTLWNEPNNSPAFLEDESDWCAGSRYRSLWFHSQKLLRCGLNWGKDCTKAKLTERVFFGDFANDSWARPQVSLCVDSTTPASARSCMVLTGTDKTRTYQRIDQSCAAKPRQVWSSGVAFHPYVKAGASAPAAMSASVATLQTLIGKAAGQSRLMPSRGTYVTEFGYCTEDPAASTPCAIGTTPSANQPQDLNQTDHLMYDNKNVKTVAQYVLVDQPGTDAWETGLYFADQMPKPARDAYRLGLDVSAAQANGDRQVFVLSRSFPVNGGTPIVFGYLTATKSWVPVTEMTGLVDALGYAEQKVPAATASQVSAWRACSGQSMSRCVSDNPATCAALPSPPCQVVSDTQCVP